MKNFYIGQQFINEYPPEAAIWCNESQRTLNPAKIILKSEINNEKIYEIQSSKQSTDDTILYKIIELQTYLKNTDWYCSRFVDTGVPIPDDVKSKRQQDRVEIEKLKKEIENTK